MANCCDLCGWTRPSERPPRSPCRKAAGSPCSACVQLSAVNREVAEAKAALTQVLKKQKALEANVNAVHDPFASRLPIEIACRILLLCAPSLPTLENFQYPAGWCTGDVPVHYHLVLGTVCQRWRQIVYSEPQFWKMIYLTFPPTTPFSYSSILDQFVRLSGELPLFIYIELSAASYEHNTTALTEQGLLIPMVHSLNRCAHRWSLVKLQLPSQYFDQLRGAASESSILQGIAMSTDFNRIHGGCFLNHSPTPAPRSVAITGFRLQNITMNWSNLTRFIGDTLTLQDFLQILQLAPLMTFCEIDGLVHRGKRIPTDPGSIVHHTFLQEMRILNDDDCDVVQYLACPSLKDLAWLRLVGYRESLSNFVIRSGCSLESLSIKLGSDDINEGHFLHFLEHTHDLKSLQIADPTDRFFQRLGATTYYDHSEGAFLPHLRRLDARGYRRFRWPQLPLLSSEVPKSGEGKSYTRRPLFEILLTLDFDPQWVMPPEFDEAPAVDLDIIDRDTLEKIMDMINEGLQIHIEQLGAGCTIEASKKCHGFD